MRFSGAFWARVALLAVSLAIGTWVLGWWAVPVLSAGSAVIARHSRHQGVATAIAAAVAWAVLLAWTALDGSVWSFARIAGGAMGISGVLLIAITLAFPAALAWTAASVTQWIARGKPATN